MGDKFIELALNHDYKGLALVVGTQVAVNAAAVVGTFVMMGVMTKIGDAVNELHYKREDKKNTTKAQVEEA